jgi:hypothetical protein
VAVDGVRLGSGAVGQGCIIAGAAGGDDGVIHGRGEDFAVDGADGELNIEGLFADAGLIFAVLRLRHFHPVVGRIGDGRLHPCGGQRKIGVRRRDVMDDEHRGVSGGIDGLEGNVEVDEVFAGEDACTVGP